MQCPKCQTENRETRKFCHKCGAKLIIVCNECGFENLPGENFCGECGLDLRESKETSLIDYTEPKSYTPKHLKDKILTTRSSIEGERKLVTVFFADVANYTSISEKLDPEEVHQIMDGCFQILMDEIHKYEGTINQFTGDGVMALFGAPVSHEDHAQRACYAAISVQKRLGEYGEQIKRDTGLEFKIRIGINSGHVIVGSIGDDLRMDYTAVGDTTNLAARMESAAKPGSVLVSQNTHKIVRHYFNFNALDKFEVKGKEDPQEAFELTAQSEVETRFDASVAKGLTRFVGRKNSMDSLMEAWEKVASGSGQVVGIVGEAGVGKSRLILEMRNRLELEEYTYLEGQCLHYGGSMTYLPILAILRDYFHIQEEDREYIIKKKIREKTTDLDKNLSSTIPCFQELFSLKADDEGYKKQDPRTKRILTFEALRDIFLRESQKKPLILVIEDLHWIDKTSEEFLDYLMGWIAKARILLLLLYRPEYTHPWGSKSYYSKIGLDQLGAESSSDLISALLEGGDVAPELRKIILNRAAGNPLFMEEFTHTLVENGTIQRKDHQYILTQDLSKVQVPDTIQGIIAARMDRLEDNLKRTMQVASVIGRDFAFRILQAITGMREELKSYLLNLQGLEFIYEKALFPELEYIFKHALTQEVAYNSLLISRRKSIHHQIGKAVEEIYVNRLEEFFEILSYHYSNSEDLEKAYLYTKLSAVKAWESYSGSEALSYFESAIHLLDQMSVSTELKKEKLAVYHKMCEILFLMAFPEGIQEVIEQGMRLAEELKDEQMQARFNFWNINHIYYRGDRQLAVEIAEDALRKAEEIEDIDSMVSLNRLLLEYYYTVSLNTQIADKVSKIIPIIEAKRKETDLFLDPINPYSYICGIGGGALTQLGDFKSGEIYFKKAITTAENINEAHALGYSYSYYGQGFVIAGQGNNAIKYLMKSQEYFNRASHSWAEYLILITLSQGYFARGNLETSLEFAEKGLESAREFGVPLLSFYSNLSRIYFAKGEYEHAKEFAEKALEIAKIPTIFEARSRVILGIASNKLNPKQFNDSLKSIQKGIEFFDQNGNKTMLADSKIILAELYADADQTGKAIKILQETELMLKKLSIDYCYWLAKTYSSYAGLFKKEGDQSKAREYLLKAIDIFKKVNADSWVEKYEKELAELS